MDLQGSGEYVPCLNFEQLVDIMELRARGPRKIQDVDGDSYIFGFPPKNEVKRYVIQKSKFQRYRLFLPWAWKVLN